MIVTIAHDRTTARTLWQQHADALPTTAVKLALAEFPGATVESFIICDEMDKVGSVCDDKRW